MNSSLIRRVGIEQDQEAYHLKENNSQIQNAPNCITFSKRGSMEYVIEKDIGPIYGHNDDGNTPMKIDDCEEDILSYNTNSD